MAERMVPVSQVEEVQAVLNRRTWPLRWEDVQEVRRLLHALLSQPTPSIPDMAPSAWEHCLSTANHEPHEWGGNEGQAGTGFHCIGFDASNEERPAAPPSIADMAPGTTFTAAMNMDSKHIGRRFEVTRMHPTTVKCSYWDSFERVSDIDPSTIRDVTPPQENP